MGLVNAESGAAPTRRERVRAQTRDEILVAARDLVRKGEEINMRAVARALGMTAPALYRYVDGHEDLLDLLGGHLYDELITELERARETLDSLDMIGRLIAMAHAFRNWALAHRYEYGLLFASPLMSAAHTNTGCTHEAGQRFGAVWADIFARLWTAGTIASPDLDHVDPDLLNELQDMDELKGIDLPLPIRYLYVRQWTRLYGMVTLEAFCQLHWALEDGVALFEAMLDDCAADLGFLDQVRAARAAARHG
ncbi:MAG: WHG domain-containing protein [Geodermatophilaceae bacterium]|nr:WHG domain-containing protein [Geodermatophilaceae bacterium]